MGFHTRKKTETRRANRNCKLHKANSCGSLQSIPDLVSTFILTDLTGSSSRPKNPSKTCAPQGPPQYSCGSIFFLHLFDCKPQNIVAVVVHESATAQEAVLLDGVAALAKRETVITFLELRIQKKSEKRPQKMGPEFEPVFGCL